MAGEVYRRPFDYRVPIQRFFAILTAAGAVAGASAVTVTPTATLTGVGALAGTCTISCSATGDATSGLNGAALGQMQFGGQGALTAQGSLAGTSAITFGENADLGGSGYILAMWKPTKRLAPPEFNYRYVDKLVLFTYTEPTGILGQSDVAFGGNGLLTATGRYVGAASFAFGGSGTLLAGGNLAGTSAITLTPTANLTGTASGSITGTAPISFTPTATLAGTGNLVGVASIVFAPSVVSGQFVSITGTSQLEFTATGTLIARTPSTGEPVRSIRFEIRAPKMRFEFL